MNRHHCAVTGRVFLVVIFHAEVAARYFRLDFAYSLSTSNYYDLLTIFAGCLPLQVSHWIVLFRLGSAAVVVIITNIITITI